MSRHSEVTDYTLSAVEIAAIGDRLALLKRLADLFGKFDGTLIQKLIDFLGSEQFAKLLELLFKFGGLFGASEFSAMSADAQASAFHAHVTANAIDWTKIESLIQLILKLWELFKPKS